MTYELSQVRTIILLRGRVQPQRRNRGSEVEMKQNILQTV